MSSLDRFQRRNCSVSCKALRAHLAAFFLSTAVVAGIAPVSAQPAPVLRIGTTPIDAGAQPYYAAAMGFFRDAGITVEITSMSSGAAIAAAVASGAIDIAQSNVVSLASAHEKGLPFVLLAPASMYLSQSPQTALIVRADSPVRSAKDLTGKVIAINGLKNIAEIGASSWLDANGGTSSSVRYVEMPMSTMSAALSRGSIDAGVVSEPDLTDALSHGFRVVGNIYDAIGKHFVIGAWFTTIQFAQAHPDLVRNYAAVMLQTARWANRNHATSGKILEAEFKTPVTPGTKRVVFGETLERADIQAPIDAAARYGALKASFPAASIMLPPQ